MEGQRRSGAPQTRRWMEQRWLVDNIILANGVDFAGQFLTGLGAAAGPEGAADAAEVRRSIRKYADISPAAEAVATRREAKAAAAEAVSDRIAARESYYVAACLWAYAQWPIVETNETNLRYNERKRECFRRYAKLADHRIEEVSIPFKGSSLSGWFHLPVGYTQGRVPAIVSITGMDGYKEKIVSLRDDPWLSRGFAVLAIEGPGQFESAVLGTRVSVPAWAEAGRLIADWMDRRQEVDPGRLGLCGRSFGTFCSTIMVANEPRYRAWAISAPCLEPGFHTIFEEAAPTFKRRFMWMAGYIEETAFDQFRRSLTWEDEVKKIRAPLLCVSGEHDELSPLLHTERLVESIDAPKILVIYQGARHGIWDSPSVSLGPSYQAFMPEWMLARVSGTPMEDERWYIEASGRLVKTPLSVRSRTTMQ
jgi:alpha-beta hydrolase superfamily lysophospholipase